MERNHSPWRCACYIGVLAITSLPFGVSAQQSAPRSPDRTPQAKAAPVPLAFEGVTVIDVKDGRLRPDQTVVVVGTRVKAVGNARKTKVPKGAQVVDARGKYLIPGLWDMHVHVFGYPQILYPLFVAYGVTGIRGMSEAFPFDSLLRWGREVATGARVGPRQIVTGGYLQGTDDAQEREDWGQHGLIVVTTPAEARHAVDSLKAAGADFIKFRKDLLREVFFAMASEARRLKIPFVGHLPRAVTAAELSDSGQRSLEHINEVPTSCQNPDAPQCAEDVARFARNGTRFTPTLSIASHIYTEDELRNDSYPLLRMMHQAGVSLLAGSDIIPYDLSMEAGFSLHEELALLVEAGLTPLEALRTATLNPVKFFNITDSIGAIAPGKLADLVLLDADPLVDIKNTTKISAVVANGRFFDRPALDALMADAEAAREKTPPGGHHE